MKLRILKLEMSRKCSFNCGYCFVIKNQSAEIHKEFLKAFKKLLAEAKLLGIETVALTGGEPILEREMCFKIIKLCAKAKIKTEVFTNGYSLNQKLIDELYKNGCKNLRFTFLTTDNNEYLKITGLKNKNLVYSIIKNVIYAKQKKFKVKVGITPLLKSNISEFQKILYILTSLNVDQIEISGMRRCENSWIKERLSKNDLTALYNKVLKVQKLKARTKILFYRCEAHKIHFSTQNILPVACGVNYLSINCFNGDVYPSTMAHIKLANIFSKNFSFKKFWRTNDFLKKVRAFNKKNKNICPLLHQYKCA